MKKIFCCKDLGIECDWEASAETTEELIDIVAEHAKKAHNMREMTEAMRLKIIGKMRDNE